VSHKDESADCAPLSPHEQLGHQAVNCTNGTINWKQIYGDDAFRLKKPIYESDYQALRKTKQVDVEDLEKRARQYAKVRALTLRCWSGCWNRRRSVGECWACTCT